MTSSPVANAANIDKSVHRNNSKKNFCKLDNNTLRTRLEGDPLTAGDIWRWALTCLDTWLFTKDIVMKQFNIGDKTAQRLLSRCVKNGVAERIEIKDPRTGRFLMYRYIFCENPVDTSCPSENEPISQEQIENKENLIKSPVDTSCPPVPIIEKDHLEDHKEPPCGQKVEDTERTSNEQNNEQPGSSFDNFGEWEKTIKSYCRSINDLPRKKLRFNPWCAALAALREGVPPEVIAKTLKSMIRDWDEFIVPFTIFVARIKRQYSYFSQSKHKKNERQFIDAANKRKEEERKFCEDGGINSLKGF